MSRRLLLIVLSVCATLVAGCGQPPDSAPQTPVGPPLEDIAIHRVAYPTEGPADPSQNWGDVYLPAGPQLVDTIPLVVLIHGGAWEAEFDAQTLHPYAMALARRGMAVYNVEYRRVGSGGGWPQTFLDVAAALDFIPVLDQEYPQLTTDDELVVGHSAGAQLAVWAATRHLLEHHELGANPAFRPTRVVSLAGPLDLVYAAQLGDDRVVTALGGSPEEVAQRYESVDPIQNIDPSVPVVAVHGDHDHTVPPILSQRYVDEVQEQGGSAAMVIAHGESHISLVNPDSAAYDTILDLITDSSSKSIEELGQLYMN